MEDLKQAYAAIEMLEKLGLPVSKEQKDVLARMEEDYLMRDIIPKLEEDLQAMVEDLINEFYLYVSYSKDNGVKISLYDCKAYNTSDNDFYKRKSSSRSRKFIIRVVFPDGRAICHKQVLNTLIEVVEAAGPDNVMNLEIPSMTGNLIATKLTNHPVYSRSQKKLSNGYYIQTNSSTDKKFEQINTINKKLNLGLKVEKVLIDKPEY